MKRMSSILCVSAILTWCGATIAEQPASAPAVVGGSASVVKAEESSFDFGNAWAGDAISHTFRLTNTGSEPLAIRNVTASCGCTVIKDYAKTIAPGATWELPATFNTKGQSGWVTKTITVYFQQAGEETAKDAKHSNGPATGDAEKSRLQAAPTVAPADAPADAPAAAPTVAPAAASAGGAGVPPANNHGQDARPPSAKSDGQDARPPEPIRFAFTGEVRGS